MCVGHFTSHAQTNEVQGGVFNPVGRTLSVKAKPTVNFNTTGNNLLTNVVVTIRWLSSLGVSMGTISSPTYGLTLSDAGTLGSYDYAVYAAANNTALTWVANNEYELFTVDVTGTPSGTFELTSAIPVGEWYVEVNANDKSNPTFYQSSVTLGPLPITLSSFAATIVNQNQVRLDWTTLTETNNYGFEVQKSQGNQNNYQAIPNSFIPGHGTTTEPHSYSYVDNSASVGSWYYRLKQIDLDATVHFTEGIQVDVLTGVNEKPLPKEFALDQNYPNPFNPSTLIRYTLPKETSVSLKVYNTLGQEVFVLAEGVQKSGEYEVRLDVGSLASGTYIYRLNTDDFTSSKKLILLR
jgi:hypothetical protein